MVVAALGFSRACIYNWLARYRAGGCAALKARPLTGCPPKINGSQLRWLYRTIVGKNPVTRIGLQPRLMNVVKFSPSVDRPAFVGAGDDEDVNVRLDGENSPSIKQSSSRATRRRG